MSRPAGRPRCGVLSEGELGVGPARDHLVLALAASVGAAERPAGAGVRSCRSHGPTSTARTIRPSAARGSGSRTSVSRSRPVSIRPWLSASWRALGPRRCTGASESPTSVLTGPAAQSSTSANSNNASPRRVKQARNSSRRKESSLRRAARMGSTGTIARVTQEPPCARGLPEAASLGADRSGTRSRHPRNRAWSSWIRSSMPVSGPLPSSGTSTICGATMS